MMKARVGLRWLTLMMSLVLCLGTSAQEYFEEEGDTFYSDFTQGDEGGSTEDEETGGSQEGDESENLVTYEETDFSSYDNGEYEEYGEDGVDEEVPVENLAVNAPSYTAFQSDSSDDKGTNTSVDTSSKDDSSSYGWPAGPDITAGTAVIVEDKNGVVLFSKNAEAQQDPGGTVKIMTALLAIEHSDMEEKVEMTSTSTSGVTDGGLTISAQVGEVFTMEQLIYAVVLASANDAALQIAEKVGGSVPAFVQMMNERAKELGCTNTTFTNPTGLEDPAQLSTGHDLALIMRVAIENPTFMQIAKTKTYTIAATNMSGGERVLTNTFEMLRTPLLDNVEILGGKQGYTQTSGNTRLWAAERDGRVLVFLLLQGNADMMDYDAMNLMDYGFNLFTLENLGDEDFDIISGGDVTLPDGFDLNLLQTKDSYEGETLMRTYYIGDKEVGNAEIDHVEQESPQVRQDGAYYLEEAKAYSEKKSILPYILIVAAGLLLTVLFVRRFGPMQDEDDEDYEDDEEEQQVAPPVRKKKASPNVKQKRD